MVYRETFLQIHKRLIRQFIQECSILWVDFFYYGTYSGASKHGETRDRKWWSRQQQQPILSQMAQIPNSFSIFSSNFWNQRFQRKAKRNRLEERFKRKDGASSPFENNLNHSAGLNGNCTTPSSCEFGKKCAWMHHQIGEQWSQKPKWKHRKAEWLKFNGNVEYAWQLVKNASGRWAAEVFMETTEEHKVLRPIKRAQILKKPRSHGKRSIAWEKMVLPEPRAVEGDVPKFALRQQRKDVSPKYDGSSTRTEMLFLWCFSAPYWEREF